LNLAGRLAQNGISGTKKENAVSVENDSPMILNMPKTNETGINAGKVNFLLRSDVLTAANQGIVKGKLFAPLAGHFIRKECAKSTLRLKLRFLGITAMVNRDALAVVRKFWNFFPLTILAVEAVNTAENSAVVEQKCITSCEQMNTLKAIVYFAITATRLSGLMVPVLTNGSA
jgi:hypothetical protein